MIGGASWLVAGLVAGAIAGSFIATLVLRWPAGRDVGGRSHCDGCQRALTARDLVPILSFAVLRGRCRTCGSPIDPIHVGVELAAALIGAFAFWASPDVSGVAGALFGWQLLALAALDLRHFWLPDRLTLLLAATGLGATVLLGANLMAHLIGGVIGFALLYAVGWSYRRLKGRSGLGGGDPKLFGAIGLWLGWQVLPIVLLVASGVGLLAVLIARAMGRDMTMGTRVPFGALLALAALPVWWLGPQL